MATHLPASEPFEVLTVETDRQWRALERECLAGGSASHNRPLHRCLQVVRENSLGSPVTVVVEHRYVDLDYRSEYSAFYSKAFESFSDTTRRLHFFSATFDSKDVWSLSDYTRRKYLGYMVLRPGVRGVVGRTMLWPPTWAVRTAVRETVHFFGQELTVWAAPFMQQDSRLGTCAHVALWMCHFSAYLGNRQVGRVPIAEFSLATNTSLGLGRNTPSTGLTLHQISDLLGAFGLPPLYYGCADLTGEDRPDWWPPGEGSAASRVCCRYLNSALPVLAVVNQVRTGSAAPARDWNAGALHAVAVVGYHRKDGDVVFVVNDDRRGPYLEVNSTIDEYDEEFEEHSRWEHLLAPVPTKLWLAGEAAELNGCSHLFASAWEAVADGFSGPSVLLDKFQSGGLAIRTYATSSSQFKQGLRGRCADDIVVSEYATLQMPRYVWVVEALDRSARAEFEDTGSPFVLGETVMDATSDHHDPTVLATRLPGLIALRTPRDPHWSTRCAENLVLSGSPASMGRQMAELEQPW